MKRIISILLVIALIIAYGCVSAFAEEAVVAVRVFEDDNYETQTKNYSTLESALSASVSGDEVYLVGSTSLTQSATVPSGVILVIQNNSALSYSLTGNNSSGGVSAGSAYVTLTIPAGVTLTVNGTLLVAGNQQSTQPKSGCMTGDYGMISLSGTLNVYGKLYARGLIVDPGSGTGKVNAFSGSSVYQLFQISDWRGGTKASSAYSAGVFPFNLYEIKNIQADVDYYAGSRLYGQYYIYALFYGFKGNVSIIGSNGLLRCSSGKISTTYDSGTLTAEIDGSVQSGDISLSFLGTNYNSSGMVLPFGYNMDVVIDSGSILAITNNLKFLPGCTIINNGTMTVSTGKALYIYGTEYSTTYNFAGWDGNNGYASITGNTPSGLIYSSTGSGTPSTTIKEYIQSSGAVTVNFY